MEVRTARRRWTRNLDESGWPGRGWTSCALGFLRIFSLHGCTRTRRESMSRATSHARRPGLRKCPPRSLRLPAAANHHPNLPASRRSEVLAATTSRNLATRHRNKNIHGVRDGRSPPTLGISMRESAPRVIAETAASDSTMRRWLSRRAAVASADARRSFAVSEDPGGEYGDPGSPQCHVNPGVAFPKRKVEHPSTGSIFSAASKSRRGFRGIHRGERARRAGGCR